MKIRDQRHHFGRVVVHLEPGDVAQQFSTSVLSLVGPHWSMSLEQPGTGSLETIIVVFTDPNHWARSR